MHNFELTTNILFKTHTDCVDLSSSSGSKTNAVTEPSDIHISSSEIPAIGVNQLGMIVQNFERGFNSL